MKKIEINPPNAKSSGFKHQEWSEEERTKPKLKNQVDAETRPIGKEFPDAAKPAERKPE